jgi:hypothetical protein
MRFWNGMPNKPSLLPNDKIMIGNNSTGEPMWANIGNLFNDILSTIENLVTTDTAQDITETKNFIKPIFVPTPNNGRHAVNADYVINYVQYLEEDNTILKQQNTEFRTELDNINQILYLHDDNGVFFTEDNGDRIISI